VTEKLVHLGDSLATLPLHHLASVYPVLFFSPVSLGPQKEVMRQNDSIRQVGGNLSGSRDDDPCSANSPMMQRR
jgi:hypothetical protein